MKNYKIFGLTAILCASSFSSQAFTDSKNYHNEDTHGLEACGNNLVLPDSDEPSLINEDIYFIGAPSGWSAQEDFRFKHKRDGIHQVRANMSNGTWYFITNASFSNLFYSPLEGVDGVHVDGESPALGVARSVNWQTPPNFGSSLTLYTGDVLITLDVDEGAQQGDANAGTITFDLCGDIDPRHYKVRDVRKSVYVETFAPALGANGGMSQDSNGNLYINDYGRFTQNGGTGTQILKVTPEGDSTVFAEGLIGPVGSHIDNQDNLYVLNDNSEGSGDLIKITPQGEKSIVASIDGSPANVTQDSKGNFYIANAAMPHITKILASGEQEIFASHPGFTATLGLIYDKQKDVIYASTSLSGDIFRIDMDGNVSIFARVPSTVGYITKLGDNIFATGLNGSRLYKINRHGKVTRIAGSGAPLSNDGVSLDADLLAPNGIIADEKNGVLYISEFSGDKNLRAVKIHTKNNH
jgi:sugar lactone lactonase YvrE